ncbi:MAG: hypothetical protein HY308_19485 [Gammaproteobacteria bacterium]|nr:hypothetical protein [Gammaproteobacteria bacterium]
MNKFLRRLTVVPVTIAVVALTAGASTSWAQGDMNEVAATHWGERSKPKIVNLKDARLKIEMNATDGDAGIQVFIDADPWKSMDIYDPNGRLIFRSTTSGRMGRQGGTELFLESAEPDFSELPLASFLERFPQGKYSFKGRGLNGEIYVGSATLTHNLPDGPVLVEPLEGGAPVDSNNAVVKWNPVGAANASPIIGYQVLVVKPQSSTSPAALPKTILDVMMPPTATSLAVPPGFLLPDTDYEWEVLALEAGGNQTLSSSFFKTAP